MGHIITKPAYFSIPTKYPSPISQPTNCAHSFPAAFSVFPQPLSPPKPLSCFVVVHSYF